MPNQKNIKNVEQLVNKMSKARSIYFTDYLGLNVSDVTALRKKFFENNVEYLVVKNTLLKIASQENDIELSEDLFVGSTAIAMSYEEPVAAAKVIKDFLKDHDLPTVKGLVFEGVYHEAGQFERFANLPSKEESLTVLAIMLNSPMQNLAKVLISSMVKVVNVLEAVKNNKSIEN